MELDASIRLAVYEHFAAECRALTPVELAHRFAITPVQAEDALVRLDREAHALVLLPGSPYVWMAMPFSAVPTSYAVRSGARTWWANCIWDALAIPPLVGVPVTIDTSCPDCAEPLDARSGEVAHFAVAARDWWLSPGYT